jgi:hypothetical protein
VRELKHRVTFDFRRAEFEDPPMSTIYRKTEKGQAEIETRAHRLLPKLRQALILVDGKKTSDELSKMVLEPETTLAALKAEGFIEVLATLADRPADKPVATPAAAAAPAAAAERRPAASPDAMRREAVRFLNDQMGPAAEVISMKLEKAKTMAELRPLLVTAAQLLRGARGSGMAETFAAKFLADDA